MNSVDALGATYNSESLDKVTKELTRVTSFKTSSRDSAYVYVIYLTVSMYMDTASHATRRPILKRKNINLRKSCR